MNDPFDAFFNPLLEEEEGVTVYLVHRKHVERKEKVETRAVVETDPSINGIPLSIQILLNMIKPFKEELVQILAKFEPLKEDDEMNVNALLNSIKLTKIYKFKPDVHYEIEDIAYPEILFKNLLSNLPTQSSVHRLIKHSEYLFQPDENAAGHAKFLSRWKRIRFELAKRYKNKYPFIKEEV